MKKLRYWILLGLLVILGVLWYPLMKAQQHRAREVTSMRNLQLWGIALNLYLIDNDNHLPRTGGLPVEEAGEEAWFNALPPYVSHPALSSLPPGRRPRPGEASFWISPLSKPVGIWDDTQFYFNYGMNKFLQPDSELRSFRIGELQKPAHVIFLTETEGFFPYVTPETVWTPWGKRPPLGKESSAHVLFCDGHVELVSRENLVNDPASLSVENLRGGGLSWFKE